MEIASFVIGIIALVIGLVTLPTAFQMWWGQPKFQIKFDKSLEDNGLTLLFAVHNLPIKSALLRFLGVVRVAPAIGATYTISEFGTNKIIASHKRVKLQTDIDDAKYTVRLESVLPGVATFLMYVNGHPRLFDYHNDEIISIEPGEYVIRASIIYIDTLYEKSARIHLDALPERTTISAIDEIHHRNNASL